LFNDIKVEKLYFSQDRPVSSTYFYLDDTDYPPNPHRIDVSYIIPLISATE